MAFKSFDQVFDANLRLPGPGGEVFVIPEGDMQVGLWCVKVITAANAVREDDDAEIEPDSLRPPIDNPDDEGALHRWLLGDANYDRLCEVGGSSLLHAFTNTVMIWHALGIEAAEAYWNSGGKGGDFPPAANRAARRSRSTTSTSTAAARKTPSPASTSGTRSRKAR